MTTELQEKNFHDIEPNEDGVFFCENHPNRETGLRCNRCGKPICASCAIRTPTGYRCQECVKGQQKVFNTATNQDYVVAIAIGGIISYIASLFVVFLGFFVIFLAPVVGGGIAEVIRSAVKRRRSKRLFQLAAAAVAIGSLLPLIFSGGLGFSILWRLVFTVVATSTVYYRLSGIQMRV